MWSERPPVSAEIDVIDYRTLYKTDKWWAAVVLIESFGRRQIALYVWANRDGVWKRRQKFTIHNRAEWDQIKEAVEELLAEVGGG